MNLRNRLNAFISLGEFLDWFCNLDVSEGKNFEKNKTSDQFVDWAKSLNKQIDSAEIHNPWFIRENVLFALKSISHILDADKLKNWISQYDTYNSKTLTVGVVLAGNIPLVGFSDFLCVLISGHIFLAKLSSKDKQLFPIISDILIEIEPGFKNKIIFTEEKINNFDMVIATGSNNTSRYFEYYFDKYPNIIRKNKSSIAVLVGNESEDELILLAGDILRYFGFGCRNVSKIYLPEKYPPAKILDAMEGFAHLVHHNKFANNHDYNSAIYLMNAISFLDNGFIIMKEDEGMFPPVSVLYYQYYKEIEEVKTIIRNQSEEIQCVVSGGSIIEGSVEFGKSQQPELSDYADNIDTMKFIASLEVNK